MLSFEKWEEYKNALEELHFLANMYRINGHFEKNVFGPYSVLYDLIYHMEHEDEPKSKIIDFIKK